MLYPLAALPAGLGLLVAYWFPYLWLRLTGYRCSLTTASYVIVKDLDGKYRVEIVRTAAPETPDHTPQPINAPPTSPAHHLQASGSADGAAKSVDLSGVFLEGGGVRYFEHRHLRYLYQPAVGKFVLLRGLDAGHTVSDLHQMKGGLLLEEQATRYAS